LAGFFPLENEEVSGKDGVLRAGRARNRRKTLPFHAARWVIGAEKELQSHDV